MKNQQPNNCRFRGFTLIEMIIVIIILSIVAVGATSLLTQGFNAYFAAQNIMDPQLQGRMALEVMSRDLRAIRSPLDISSATANSITFVDVDSRNIYYQFYNGQLQRKISDSGSYQALASNVQSIAINYYDATGATATQNTSIRYIVVTLTMNINNVPLTLNTGVYPWNLN